MWDLAGLVVDGGMSPWVTSPFDAADLPAGGVIEAEHGLLRFKHHLFACELGCWGERGAAAHLDARRAPFEVRHLDRVPLWLASLIDDSVSTNALPLMLGSPSGALAALLDALIGGPPGPVEPVVLARVLEAEVWLSEAHASRLCDRMVSALTSGSCDVMVEREALMVLGRWLDVGGGGDGRRVLVARLLAERATDADWARWVGADTRMVACIAGWVAPHSRYAAVFERWLRGPVPALRRLAWPPGWERFIAEVDPDVSTGRAAVDVELGQDGRIHALSAVYGAARIGAWAATLG